MESGARQSESCSVCADIESVARWKPRNSGVSLVLGQDSGPGTGHAANVQTASFDASGALLASGSLDGR